MLAVHQLVHAGEAVAQDDNRAVRIVLIRRSVGIHDLVAHQGLGSKLRALTLGQARMQIAVTSEGFVLGLVRLAMRGDALVPRVARDALGDDLRRQFQATRGPVRVLRLIEWLACPRAVLALS